MMLWFSRGIVIGALTGCALMAVVGHLLGGLMGSLASLPSLGNPNLIKSESLRLASHGAALGVFVGSVVGGLIGVFGHVRVATVGAAVGALSLAIGGAAFGSITVNDSPINWTKLIVLALIGAGVGVIVGAALGWIASPLDRYFVGRLRGDI